MKAMTALLIGSTALMPIYAYAADTATASQAPSEADCDRLVMVIEQHKVQNAPITLDQAKAYQRNKNIQACHDAMMRPDMASASQASGTQVTLQQTAPTVKVDEAAPQVSVQQAQPNVTVNQPQPEIMVHQPAPTVTVDIPQPEITIRMPKPQVNVSMTQPTVQVSQPKPTVQVVQPAQPQVDVQKSSNQANVTVRGDQQAPKVSYTSDKAKVVVNQSKTAPTIKTEQVDQSSDQNQSNSTAQNGSAATTNTNAAPAIASTDATPNASTEATSSTSEGTRQVKASNLMKMNVLNAKGNTLGDVEHVLMNNKDHKPYVVIGHGGFLGLGEKQVALPLDSMYLRNHDLIMRGLTDDQIRAMPSWTRDNHDYTDFTANETAPISTAS